MRVKIHVVSPKLDSCRAAASCKSCYTDRRWIQRVDFSVKAQEELSRIITMTVMKVGTENESLD